LAGTAGRRPPSNPPPRRDDERRASTPTTNAFAIASCRKIRFPVVAPGQQRLVSLALKLRAPQAAVPPEFGLLGDQLDRAVAYISDSAGKALVVPWR
jgi:hypothetical protein